jgi:hypothetical protein
LSTTKVEVSSERRGGTSGDPWHSFWPDMTSASEGVVPRLAYNWCPFSPASQSPNSCDRSSSRHAHSSRVAASCRNIAPVCPHRPVTRAAHPESPQRGCASVRHRTWGREVMTRRLATMGETGHPASARAGGAQEAQTWRSSLTDPGPTLLSWGQPSQVKSDQRWRCRSDRRDRSTR